MTHGSYNTPPELIADMDSARSRWMIIGLIGLAATVAGFFLDQQRFYQSYLYAFVFVIGFPMGLLALTMLNHLTGGAWGIMIRRIAEAGCRTFPVMLVLFVPIALGVPQLFPWASHEAASDHLLHEKLSYLNVPFFYVRAALYFAIWLFLSFRISGLSSQQDQNGSEPYFTRLQRTSGPGLLLYAFTVTFASIDWIMSLDPHWFSTIFGILLLGCQGVTAFSFAIMMLVWLMRRPPMSEAVTSVHLHDLGKLMFAFVNLFAYFNFSQFLIIWSGNLPEETTWYLKRTTGGWEYVSIAIMVLHFFVPFFLLLSRNLKRTPGKVTKVAGWLIFMQLVNAYWLVMPSLYEKGIHLHWLDLAAPVGIGGIWMWAFFGQLKTRPVLPVQDPMLEEALHSAGH
ncbi:MAG: hypothetical protein ACKV22_36920 [Bryobacteraceae bacterium]